MSITLIAYFEIFTHTQQETLSMRNTDSMLNTLPTDMNYDNRKQFEKLFLETIPTELQSRYKGLSVFSEHKGKRDDCIRVMLNHRVSKYHLEYFMTKKQFKDNQIKSYLKTYSVLRSQLLGLYNTYEKHCKKALQTFPCESLSKAITEKKV